MNHIKDLELKIRRHNDLYYNYVPEITDEEYDQLVAEMKLLDPNNPVLDEVGAPVLGSITMRHKYKMYSLDKVMDLDEFLNGFAKKFSGEAFLCSQKLDGCAVEIFYNNGRLQYALTRGDGEVGQVVTEQVKVIENVPEKIPLIKPLHVYGECVISNKDFEEIGEGYTNSRNLVNGTIRPDGDLELVKERNVRFFAYNVIKQNNNIGSLNTDLFYIGKDQGFETVPKDWGEVEKVIKMYNECLKNRDRLDFQIDGICVFVDNKSDWDSIGYTSHHPKFAVAIKFPSESKIVEVIRVRWDISRTGTLTPVAEFEPILLGGAIVQNVTLHNWDTGKNISKGTKIRVKRSGDVIPCFMGVVEYPNVGNTNCAPIICPYCGEKTVNDGVRLKCSNEGCPQRLVMLTEDILDRLNHKGLATKQIEELYYNTPSGFKSPWLLWKIPEQDFNVLGYNQGPKVYKSLHEIKKGIPLWRMIYALCIPMVGKKASKELANYYKTFDKFWIDKGQKRYREYRIGEELERYIEENPGLKFYLETLSFEIKEIKEETTMHNYSFCVTGTLSIKRKEFEELVESKGYIFSSSVTKDLDYLVVGENPGENKLAKAHRYQIATISEKRFNEIMEV